MDLLSFGKDRWQTLPKEEAIFESSSACLPRFELETDSIVALRATRDYHSLRVDSIWMSLTREAAFRLGLLLIDTMLTPTSLAVVNLNNPKSHVARLELNVGSAPPDGLQFTPRAFVYLASRLHKHPWYPLPDTFSRFDLPHLSLTNRDGSVITDSDRRDRNVVRGFGSPLGCSRFAQLLLDLAQDDNPTLEVDLEHEPGFAGVAPSSCELRLALPGSPIYESCV